MSASMKVEKGLIGRGLFLPVSCQAPGHSSRTVQQLLPIIREKIVLACQPGRASARPAPAASSFRTDFQNGMAKAE